MDGEHPTRNQRTILWITVALIFAVGALAYDGLRRQRALSRMDAELQAVRTEIQSLQEQAREQDKRAREAKDRALNAIAD